MADDLRALAAAATPGPWFAECSMDHPDDPEPDWLLEIARWGGSAMCNTVSFCDDEATARYVAAVSPDVVVGLLDEIARLRDALIVGNQMMGTMKGPRSPADEGPWLAFELALADIVNDGGLPGDPLARPALSDAAKARLALPDAPRLKVAADDLLPIESAATPVDGVVDLMAELERSVAAAKEARVRHKPGGTRLDDILSTGDLDPEDFHPEGGR